MALASVTQAQPCPFQSGSHGDLQGPERRYSTPLQLHQEHFSGARDDAYAFGSSPSLQYHSAHASPNMGLRATGMDHLRYSPQSHQSSPLSQRPLSQVRQKRGRAGGAERVLGEKGGGGQWRGDGKKGYWEKGGGE